MENPAWLFVMEYISAITGFVSDFGPDKSFQDELKRIIPTSVSPLNPSLGVGFGRRKEINLDTFFVSDSTLVNMHIWMFTDSNMF